MPVAPAALDTDRQAEGRRLREDLFRRDPLPGARERYEAFLGAAETAPQEPEQPDRAGRRRLPRRPVVVAALALLAVAATVGALALRPHDDPHEAEPIVPTGPYAVADREALAAILDPSMASGPDVVRAVQRSDAPALEVWHGRPAGAVLGRWRGSTTRDYGAGYPTSSTPRPLSVLIACQGASRYRWTLRGTTTTDRSVHVLGTASSAACGRAPTAATVVLPAGSVVRGFDVAVPGERRWAMALIYPFG